MISTITEGRTKTSTAQRYSAKQKLHPGRRFNSPRPLKTPLEPHTYPVMFILPSPAPLGSFKFFASLWVVVHKIDNWTHTPKNPHGLTKRGRLAFLSLSASKKSHTPPPESTHPFWQNHPSTPRKTTSTCAASPRQQFHRRGGESPSFTDRISWACPWTKHFEAAVGSCLFYESLVSTILKHVSQQINPHNQLKLLLFKRQL